MSSALILKAFILASLLLVMWARPAWAGYIDPNTGGMLFQMLAVAFAFISGLFFFYAGKVRMLFARLRRSFRAKLGWETPDEA
jgi:hypothetical protein